MLEILKINLKKILKSKKKKIGLIKNGFEKIRQYNWDKCAYKTSEVYKKIIY